MTSTRVTPSSTWLLASPPRCKPTTAGRRSATGAVSGFGCKLAPTRLDRRGPPALALQPGEPVVLTGGARGITASVALELARRWRPTLLLIGRSPLPPDYEDPTTAAIDEAAPLKAALLDRLKNQQRSVTPIDLERSYQAVRQEREIRQNLGAIRQAGARVEYAQADVRDPAVLGGVLNSWRARFGPIAGFIHGAGVIQDKRISDKTLASWDLVMGTKIDGALNLARGLDADPLRFAAFFSSIAGRFGNVGQSDYAAANEFLNKLALRLDGRWAGRVVAVNWGPWSGVGMVADLEGHLGGRGLGMILPEVGSTLLVDELEFGSKGRVEIVVAGDLGTLDAPIDPVGIAAATGSTASPVERPVGAAAVGAGR